MEQEKEIQKENYQNPLAMPFAIIIAGVIVAAAIIYAFGNKSGTVAQAPSPNQQAASVSLSLNNIKPITSSDHIKGDINAPVKIIEFSDPECPYCKQFQSTLDQVIALYPGKVAWVYRHYPIDQLHPKARHEVVATECAAKLGGNDAFWKYLDGIFAITPSNNGLDPAQLPIIAGQIGLNTDDFNKCLASNEFDNLIESEVEEAQNSGAQGTPYSVVITPNGTKTEIPGAYPLSYVKSVIDSALVSK
jgi:protein-disulfide isomerase